MVTIGVLALQGDVAEHVRALENSGARALLVRRVSELDQVDGLVIPGGESTTMSNLLLSFGLFDALHARMSAGLPVYGTCAGMIMLASSILDGREDQRSFGALDMVVRRNAFGRQVLVGAGDTDVDEARSTRGVHVDDAQATARQARVDAHDAHQARVTMSTNMA